MKTTLSKLLVSLLAVFSLVSCANSSDRGAQIANTSDAEAENITEARTTTETSQVTPQTIEEKPFDLHDMFKTITVENVEYHLLDEGILLAPDKSVRLTFEKLPDESTNKIIAAIDAIGKIEEATDYFDEHIRFIFDDVELMVCFNEEKYAPADEDSTISFFAYSMTSHGHTKIFEPEEYEKNLIDIDTYAGDHIGYYQKSSGSYSYLSILSDNDASMYITTSPSPDYQIVYVFSDTGIHRINSYENSTCTTSFYNFEYDNNGRIAYTRKPQKYRIIQHWGMIFDECVARDEFAKEEGYVTFESGTANYHPEKRYTIGDLYDLDRLYAEFKKTAWNEYTLPDYNEEQGFCEYNGIPLLDTVDEMAAYNSTKYERAH